MLRDDDDVEGYVPLARQLERGGKQNPEAVERKARKDAKKLRELQKRVELQTKLQQPPKDTVEAAKTKTREEEIREERAGAQQKTTAEDMTKREAQQDAKKEASPFEYQQNAG